MKKKLYPTCRILTVFSDDRGIFAPFVQNIEEVHGGLKRIYYIVNHAKGTIRGFHFHKREWKHFTILKGAAKFVSLQPTTHDKIYTFISSDRLPNMISIPPGFANGWMSLEDNTILLCASSLTIEESINDDKRYDPFHFGDVWSVKSR